VRIRVDRHDRDWDRGRHHGWRREVFRARAFAPGRCHRVVVRTVRSHLPNGSVVIRKTRHCVR
jgi:hypothetical protein